MIHSLENMSPARGSNAKKKRLGRGPGSGMGKTSARGGKGQTARKGGGVRAGFEGGQTPLYRRLPKRGFFNIHAVKPAVIRLGDLNAFQDGDKVTIESLKEKKLAPSDASFFKVIATGQLKKKLEIHALLASAGAKAAIAAVGGTFVESKNP